MKRILLGGLFGALLVGGMLLAIPAFAQGSGGGEEADPEAGEAMYEACSTGDWEGMANAAEEMLGSDFADMPCSGGGDMGEGMMDEDMMGEDGTMEDMMGDGHMSGEGMMGGGMMSF